MSVFYSEKDRSFRLDANNTSYMMKYTEEGYLCHVYFGAKVPDDDLGYLLRFDESPLTPLENNRDRATFLDTTPFEYSCFGIGDYREAAFKILDDKGMTAADLR